MAISLPHVPSEQALCSVEKAVTARLWPQVRRHTMRPTTMRAMSGERIGDLIADEVPTYHFDDGFSGASLAKEL